MNITYYLRPTLSCYAFASLLPTSPTPPARTPRKCNNFITIVFILLSMNIIQDKRKHHAIKLPLKNVYAFLKPDLKGRRLTISIREKSCSQEYPRRCERFSLRLVCCHVNAECKGKPEISMHMAESN